MDNRQRIIPLQGALNARELGGIPLKDGKTVKHGKIIRTGRLSALTAEDKALLRDKWHVTRIVDLRNNGEVSEYPDMELEGALYQQIAIIPGEKEGISREDHGMSLVDRAIMRAEGLARGDGAQALLEGMYAQMAADEYCLDRIRDFFDMMLEHDDGAFIWHCTSGKDRTGVTGALMLYALGADLEAIKEDYLYTNLQNGSYRENLLDMMREHGAGEDLVHEIRVLESVDWLYIESFLGGLVKTYGSLEDFLEKRMGLDSAKMTLLKAKYTE